MGGTKHIRVSIVSPALAITLKSLSSVGEKATNNLCEDPLNNTSAGLDARYMLWSMNLCGAAGSLLLLLYAAKCPDCSSLFIRDVDVMSFIAKLTLSIFDVLSMSVQ